MKKEDMYSPLWFMDETTSADLNLLQYHSRNGEEIITLRDKCQQTYFRFILRYNIFVCIGCSILLLFLSKTTLGFGIASCIAVSLLVVLFRLKIFFLKRNKIIKDSFIRIKEIYEAEFEYGTQISNKKIIENMLLLRNSIKF